MKNFARIILVLLFFGLLLLPQAVDKFIGVNSDTSGELRNLTPFPDEFKYRKIAAELEEYYNDRIPLRPLLLDGCRNVQSRIFPFTLGNVVIGKEGFLFFRKPGWEDQVDQFRGKEKIRKYELLKAQKFLTTLHNFLKSKNIQFLTVIAPNKVQIYPEMLPERRKYQASENMPDLQLVRFMQEHSPEVPLLHLQKTVLDAKKYYGCDLFYRHDTHWGLVGGYIGAREIIRHFSPQAELPAAGTFPIIPSGKNEPADLTNQSLNKITAVKYPELKPQLPAYTGEIKKISGLILYTCNPAAPDKRRVLMFRDSFANALIPYLSCHFQEVYYVRTQKVPLSLIEKTAPDIVILEYVARIIGRMHTKLR